MWTYNTATGHLKHDGKTISEGRGAASPGPYLIGMAENHDSGPADLTLLPQDGSGRRVTIHGAARGDGLVFPAIVRNLMWRSGDRELRVL